MSRPNFDFTVFADKIREGRKIDAIKMIRDEYRLPLITAKCLMEILQIIDGEIICPKCHLEIHRDEIRIPFTLQKGRDSRTN